MVTVLWVISVHLNWQFEKLKSFILMFEFLTHCYCSMKYWWHLYGKNKQWHNNVKAKFEYLAHGHFWRLFDHVCVLLPLKLVQQLRAQHHIEVLLQQNYINVCMYFDQQMGALNNISRSKSYFSAFHKFPSIAWKNWKHTLLGLTGFRCYSLTLVN